MSARDTIARWLEGLNKPAYRVNQILPRLWQRPVRTWDDATDVPRDLRERLNQDFPLPAPHLETEERSQDGTRKLLWRFARGGSVESVWIPERRRRTLCISSQAGCAYGCTFCATGRMGFVRHLDPWEITAQVREMMLRAEYGRPSSIVFMGMGEPLHNWGGVDRSLSIMNHPDGMGIGARHITVSTIGLIPGLRHLAARPEQFGVAWSLHAASGETRRALMPVEQKYPMDQVREVLRAFPRRVTIEHVMIAEVNDSDDDAERLADIALDLRAHVNLLPLHPGGGSSLRPTSARRIREYRNLLRRRKVNATVRASRGLDISAACGQLRIAHTTDDVETENHTYVQ